MTRLAAEDDTLRVQARERLVELWETVGQGHGSRPLVPSRVAIDDRLPLAGLPLSEVLDQLESEIVQGCVNYHHPLFLAFVTPPALAGPGLAELVAACLNQNVSFANLAPAGTALEGVVVDWLGEIVGLGPSTRGGVLTSGGSMANMNAIAIARNRAGLDRPSRKQPRIYCSSQIHRSVHKAALLLGLGPDSVCEVSVDKEHQVCLDSLRAAVESDLGRRGVSPFLIVAAAGTRVCGAFDDLAAARRIADEYGLWLHVDAAFGGFLRLLREPPPGLEGLGAADSITLDPHKLLFCPFSCGALLVRDRATQVATFGTEGEYLESSEGGMPDIAEHGTELGRPMRGLAPWMALKLHGVDSFAAECTRLTSLNSQFRTVVDESHDFELVGPGPSIVSCFRWIGNDGRYRSMRKFLDSRNHDLRVALYRRGLAYVNEVRLGGKTALRVCFSNYRTSEEHLEELLAIAREAAASLMQNR